MSENLGHRPPMLFVINDRLWIGPHPIDGIQCVARTRSNTRCKNWVETSQVGRWEQLVSRHGLISVYAVGRDDRWLAQHCVRHDSPDTVDHELPDWEAFGEDNPEHTARFVRPLPDTWEAIG
ncbi:hypothetical protein ACIRYZ_43505 [Kitasatospora sp. NPDC101155]|uniref:hypothetical protein n=1 Tax=Kitasatospora sp. NPDC101155 TaxID=3364097 RepID=UPI00381A508E